MSEEFTDFEIQVPGLAEANPWDGTSQPPLDEGEYVLQIVKFESKTSSNNNKMIAVTFEVVEPAELVGQKAWQNYALTDKAMGRIKALMVACGTSLDAIRASEFMGAKLRATVVHNMSTPKPDASGNVGEPKVFANVQNERPVDDAPAATTTTQQPPIKAANQKPATTTAPKNGAGAPRRA